MPIRVTVCDSQNIREFQIELNPHHFYFGVTETQTKYSISTIQYHTWNDVSVADIK